METITFSKAEMEPRIVRPSALSKLEDFAGRTGDLSEETRKAALSQTVYGALSPSGEGNRNFWDSAATSAGVPNVGAVYVTCAPGEGASWHVHRYSYENFVAMRGRWRIYWNAPEQEEHVDLDPFDMVSVPPGVIRRFEYLGDEPEGLMMVFAYADRHSLLAPYETFFPECELERLDGLGANGTQEQADFAARMREVAAAANASETEEDRAFTRAVRQRTLAEGEAG